MFQLLGIIGFCALFENNTIKSMEKPMRKHCKMNIYSLSKHWRMGQMESEHFPPWPSAWNCSQSWSKYGFVLSKYMSRKVCVSWRNGFSLSGISGV